MLVSLRLFSSTIAEEFVLQFQFLRYRAFRAVAFLFPVNTHETLPIIAKQEFFCIFGTVRVRRAVWTDTHPFK